MTSPKVLHVFHHFAPCTGGVETVILQTAKHSEAKSSVVCLNKCPKGGAKLKAQETREGIVVKRIPFINLGFYKFAPAVARHLREADLLHVHGTNFFSDFLALTAWLHRKPMVLSTHGGIFHTGAGIFKKIYFYGWQKIALHAYRKIVCVSRQDYELFSKIVPKQKLALIENGVECKGLLNNEKKKKNSFLFLGRISKNKRIDRILDALAMLDQDFEFHVAGMDFDNLAGWLLEKARAKGIEEKFFMHGIVSDKKRRELLGKSEFFVSASEYEGFGITALEGMAAGCIPILNNIDSFRGFVKTGETGFIIDFTKAKKAGNQIQKICSLKAREKNKLRKNAVARACDFSWKKKVPEFSKLYSEVLV
ncbi:MAG: glycosyltransferase family 4 protein [Candidatus Diapherotrites archaeon]|nr:glycosyltransferase family 4 protein [Candidatus Diapherotrites archaeon]